MIRSYADILVWSVDEKPRIDPEIIAHRLHTDPISYVDVVLVSKGSKKWSLCVDLIDLNKTYLKDNYPLPSIYALINGTVGCELMSFLDVSLGISSNPLPSRGPG